MGTQNAIRAEERRASAKVRQDNARTPAEQLKHLDTVLGVGQGAAKERAKLAKKLAKTRDTGLETKDSRTQPKGAKP